MNQESFDMMHKRLDYTEKVLGGEDELIKIEEENGLTSIDSEIQIAVSYSIGMSDADYEVWTTNLNL